MKTSEKNLSQKKIDLESNQDMANDQLNWLSISEITLQTSEFRNFENRRSEWVK